MFQEVKAGIFCWCLGSGRQCPPPSPQAPSAGTLAAVHVSSASCPPASRKGRRGGKPVREQQSPAFRPTEAAWGSCGSRQGGPALAHTSVSQLWPSAPRPWLRRRPAARPEGGTVALPSGVAVRAFLQRVGRRHDCGPTEASALFPTSPAVPPPLHRGTPVTWELPLSCWDTFSSSFLRKRTLVVNLLSGNVLVSSLVMCH